MAFLNPHLLWLLLLHLSPCTSAQTYQNVSLGSSLSTFDLNPSWDSPSGEFSFGFRPTQGDLFLLAIWFAKIPLKTIVWTANGGNPVQRGSKVQLRSNGVLYLSSPNGTVLESWDGRQVTSAAMLNSGNFVLVSSDSTIAWESFKNPTDTFLPRQIFEQGGNVFSRVTEDNYTHGRFFLALQTDGNLVFYPFVTPQVDNHYPAYWSSMTTANIGQVSKLIFNQSGYIYLALTDGTSLTLTSGVPDSMTDFYHRATLDFDGVLRQYTYPKSRTRNGSWPHSWSFAWSIPENICTIDFGEVGSGVCGFNSYCKIKFRRPTCDCLPGYIYSDPSNTFGGCKQNFATPSCEPGRLKARVGYEMRQLLNINWARGGYEMFKLVTEDWCRETCLNDCLCAAAVTLEGNCWLKKFPFSNGKFDPTSNGKTHVKVGNSSTEQAVRSSFDENQKEKVVWSMPRLTFLGTSAFVNLILLLLVPLFIYFPYRKNGFQKRSDTCSTGVNLRNFTYMELEAATNGFSEELGQGACSTVYKGSLEPSAGIFVAVKRFEKVLQVDSEFKAEVSAIGRTDHRNLVQLLGFCHEGPNRLLVYEYMKNGTLAEFLFGTTRPNWSLRIQIACGIARGLAYLHEDCSTQIIHCDVKPQNILLDDFFTARISDFGLAKLLKSDESRTTTAIRGTRGYVAPEWFHNMGITAKVDVYSFGIMLLEIICCRRNVEPELVGDDIYVLSDLACECCTNRQFHLLVENDDDAKNDKKLEKMVFVAISCIQEDPSLRPSMEKVTEMLEGLFEVCMPPDPTSFTSSIG